MIGFVLTKGSKITSDGGHRGEERYIRRLYDVISPMADIEFVEVGDSGHWDILALSTPYKYNEKNAMIEEWLRDSSDKSWYIGGWRDPTLYNLQFNRGIYWNPRAAKISHWNGTCITCNVWYPPLYSMDCKKKDTVVFSFVYPHSVMRWATSIADRIHEDFGLKLHATRCHWLGYHRRDTAFLESVAGNHLAISGKHLYLTYQEMIASARITITPNEKPSMLPMESWVHGTPAITCEHQEVYLESDYGIHVPRYEIVATEQVNLVGEMFANDVYNAIAQIMQGELDSQIARTVERMRFISNPERQIDKMRGILEEDLNE